MKRRTPPRDVITSRTTPAGHVWLFNATAWAAALRRECAAQAAIRARRRDGLAL